MFRKISAFLLLLMLFSGCATVSGYDGRAGDEELKTYIRELCTEYGVPETMVFAVIEKESSWNADAVNYNETCFGLMQISVVNFAWLKEELGLDDLKQPYQNVQAGIYMLSGYLEKYLDYHMALMCYNCGEGGARQLWKKGYYSSAYSRWVVNRMDELEWEALDAAREQQETAEETMSVPDVRPETQATTAEDTLADRAEETVSCRDELVLYAEDIVLKSVKKVVFLPVMVCIAPVFCNVNILHIDPAAL